MIKTDISNSGQKIWASGYQPENVGVPFMEPAGLINQAPTK